MRSIVTILSAVFLGAGLAAPATAGATFDAVKAKGFVQCGVNGAVPGFSSPDSRGNWTGIDVDLCKAIAAAMFGDATKVKYMPVTAQQRFVALQSGEIDVLTRNATRTLMRDAALGFNMAGINYFDGQGFIVPKKLNMRSAKQLNGATVCVQPGTTTELNLADYFAHEQHASAGRVGTAEAINERRLSSGRCDVYTTDMPRSSRRSAPRKRAIRRITSSCRSVSRRSRSARWCGAATTNGSMS